MSDWLKTTLGEVVDLAISAVQVDPHARYDIVGVLNRGRGLLHRDAIMGAGTSYKTLNRIEPNQVVYSRLKAFEGAITVAPATIPEVYASQEFPTFDCGPSLLPGFFRLLTTTQRMWDALQSLSTGMGGRRERVKPADFLTMPICLPSLAEQCRIVDVMVAVDAQIEALKLEVESHRAFLATRRAELVNNVELATVPAGEAFDIRMGRQRSPERATGPSMTPYLRSANVGVGVLNLADVKEMDFDAKERTKYSLAAGDVLVSEGSASEKAVGMASVWLDEMEGPVCFQNTLLRYRAIDGMSVPSFVNHWCKWAFESGTFRDAASGTNIKHIGSTRAVAMPVALPGIPRQAGITAELNSVEAGWETLATELRRFRAFRSALLSSLLSQDVKIPESYDAALAAGLEGLS